jgi:PST family polysaccharide transporter
LNKKRIALTLFSALISEITNKIVPLITLHFVASKLGTSAFGVSQFAMWLLDWGIFATVYGFTQVGPIMLSKAKTTEDQRNVHGSVVFSRLLLAVISTFILFLAVQEPSNYAPYKWAVLSSITILFTSAIDASWILMARQKMTFWSLLSIFAKLGSLIAILQFIQSPDDAVKFVVITSLANSFISVSSFLIALRLIGISMPSHQQIRSALKLSTPFAVSTLFMMLLDRYDWFIVERYLGPSDTGIYSAAAKLVASITPITVTITTIFYSEMMAHQDRDSIERHLKASIFWAVSALAPVVVGVWFVDGDILALIFGPQFATGARTLSLLISASAFYGVITIFGFQLLTLKGLWKPLVYALGLGAAAGVSLSLSFINQFGMMAVASSAIVGKFVCAMIVAHVAMKIWRLNGTSLLLQTIKAAVPAAIMGVSLYGFLLGKLIPAQLAPILSVAAVIYGCAFTALNFREMIDIYLKVRGRILGRYSA